MKSIFTLNACSWLMAPPGRLPAPPATPVMVQRFPGSQSAQGQRAGLPCPAMLAPAPVHRGLVAGREARGKPAEMLREAPSSPRMPRYLSCAAPPPDTRAALSSGGANLSLSPENFPSKILWFGQGQVLQNSVSDGPGISEHQVPLGIKPDQPPHLPD